MFSTLRRIGALALLLSVSAGAVALAITVSPSESLTLTVYRDTTITATSDVAAIHVTANTCSDHWLVKIGRVKQSVARVEQDGRVTEVHTLSLGLGPKKEGQCRMTLSDGREHATVHIRVEPD